jgi:beta-lactamase regulating signal transducer with metallopeptidase domain
MQHHMTWVDVLMGSTLRGTIVLLAAGAAALALRRSSAAVRHFVWTAALAGLLLLPVVQWIGQRWGVPIAPPTAGPLASLGASAPPTTITVRGRAPHAVAWPLILWAVGCAGSAGWFLLGLVRVRQIRRSGAPPDFAVERPARLLVSEAAPVPMVCGLWRPAVVLPASARDWPAARLRTVLEHELTHIQRKDLLTQILGQIACCLYWFHPLVWLAARQLAVERERACDDAVLTSGIAATEYATHLMELAQALGRRMVCAPAMAESSSLEKRIRVLLDGRRNRRPLTPQAALAIACGIVALLLPLAAVKAQAPAPAGPIQLAGKVSDPTGAVTPLCTVTATSLDDPNATPVTTRTSAVGVYTFAGLLPGRYRLDFSLPGFAVTTLNVVLAAGQAPAEADIHLAVGSVREMVTVHGQRPATSDAKPAAATPRRVKVGGNVQAARLIVQVPPVYPPELQQAGIAGSVVLSALISKTGEPQDLRVVSPYADQRLAQAPSRSRLSIERRFRAGPRGHPASERSTDFCNQLLKTTSGAGCAVGSRPIILSIPRYAPENTDHGRVW